MTGQDLAQLSVEDLQAVVDEVSVYARVSPEHKLKHRRRRCRSAATSSP